MNRFMEITKSAINRHGLTCTYKVVQEGVYDVSTGTVTNTEVNYSLKLYRKHIRANQYNYPNLVDKEIAEFYLCAEGLGFIPKAQDIIVFNSEIYKVISWQSHSALSEVILYKIIGVRQ